MSVELIADRYAGAICDLVNDDELDELLTALRSLEECFQPVMDEVFTNPNVSDKRRLELFDRIFEKQDAEYLKRFCKLLVRKNRFRYFGEIVDACEDHVNHRLGRKPARVKTAFDLSESHRESIRTQLGELFDADIMLDEETAPQLLAGLRVKIDDYLMDYTVSRQLDELRSRFSGGSV